MSRVADGPEIRVSGGARPPTPPVASNASGSERHHLLGPHHADVVVGDEGERPPALARPVVEDERAGVGDRQKRSR